MPIVRITDCDKCGEPSVIQGEHRCKISTMYSAKIVPGFCPHCRVHYKNDITEPVEVWEPWTNRKVWTSCWKCFTRKLEG